MATTIGKSMGLALLGACWLGMPGVAWARPESAAPADLIRARLAADGFENVRVRTAPGVVVAHLENRTYRWQVRGLGAELNIACRCASPADEVTVVVRRLDLPVLTVRVGAREWLAFAAGGSESPRLVARSGLDPAATASPPPGQL